MLPLRTVENPVALLLSALPEPNIRKLTLTCRLHQTNSTRAKTLELHIQRRVADELDKIQKRESDTLNNLRRRLKEEADHLDSQPPTDKSSTDSKPEPKSPSVKDRLANLLDIPSLSAKDLLPSSITPSSSSSKDTDKESTTKSVQAEIEKLKHQLDSRKKIKEVPRSVEQAREKLVGCLRVNDRRPLDCWKEVEGFKAEVRRLEGEFVEGVL